MKANNIFKISTLSFLMVLCLPLFSQIQTFEWQGVQRQYLVRSPQHTDKSTTPVLYFLHEKYLNLWPNPTSGCFTIKVESATDIEVMDCQGLCVGRFDLKPGANSIDLSGLTEGLYFIKGANGIASKVLLTK